jgi:hypothetical protein
MATLQQLETALVNAHNAGDSEAARRLAKVINQERNRRAADPSIELFERLGPTDVPGTVVKPPEPDFGEKITGVGEAALTATTGATTGTIGMIGGTLKQIANEMLAGEFGSYEAADRIEQEAMKGMQALTYAPKTESGQEYVETIGEVAAPLAAITPMTAELQAISASSRAVAPIARAATEQRVVKPIAQATRQATERAKQLVPQQLKPKATPGTGTSAGAQAVDKGVLRQAQAEGLPVPIKLTEGQKTRAFEQQRFERETAKLPEQGVKLRARFEEQNLKLQQNLDKFIDATGSELTDLRGIGEIVDKALRDRAAKDKVKIRTLYKEAEKAGEMETSVDVAPLLKSINDLESVESTAPVVSAAKAELLRLGIASKDADGRLIMKRAPAQRGETLKYLTQDDIETLKDTSRKDFYDFIKKVEDILDETDDDEIAWDMIDELSYESQIRLPESFKIETMVDTNTGKFAGLRLSPDTVHKLNEWFSETRKTAIKNELTSIQDEMRREAARNRKEFPGTARVDAEDYGGLIGLAPEAGSASLKSMEQLRKFINKVAGNDPTNIKFASDIKRAIDDATEGLGGDAYKRARAARAKYAQDYENVGLVKQLLNTKRGTDDRVIAMEDVLRRSILQPSASLDTVRQLRRLLQTEGDSGKQAWKELQGGTLRHIRDEALKSVATDQAGNRIVSPAQLDRVINQLDKSGKLDFIFGKKGAEQLRVINDVAKVILTSPPGAVNTSNTATVLAGLMDVALSGTTGIPAPVATSFSMLTSRIKDAKLKAKIKRTLGDDQ